MLLGVWDVFIDGTLPDNEQAAVDVVQAPKRCASCLAVDDAGEGVGAVVPEAHSVVRSGVGHLREGVSAMQRIDRNGLDECLLGDGVPAEDEQLGVLDLTHEVVRQAYDLHSLEEGRGRSRMGPAVIEVSALCLVHHDAGVGLDKGEERRRGAEGGMLDSLAGGAHVGGLAAGRGYLAEEVGPDDSTVPADVVAVDAVDAAAHEGGRGVVFAIDVLDDASSVVDDVDPCLIADDKGVVCRVELRLGAELPAAGEVAGDGVVDIEIPGGGEQGDLIDAADAPKNGERQALDTDAVIPFRRSLASKQTRHLHKLAVIAVLAGIQLDGVDEEPRAEVPVILNDSVHVDMASGEHLTADALGRELLVAKGAGHQVPHERVVVLQALGVPHPGRLPTPIHEVQRVDETVIGDLGDVGDRQGDLHVGVVGGVDRKGIGELVVVVIRGIERQGQVAEGGG